MSVWVSLGRRLLRSIYEEVAFRESFSARLFAKNRKILPKRIPFRIIWVLYQVAEMIAGTNRDRLKRFGRFSLAPSLASKEQSRETHGFEYPDQK